MLHIQKQKTHFLHFLAFCFFCVLSIKNKLLEGHPMNISTKFDPCRLSGFREILKQYMDMDDSD